MVLFQITFSNFLTKDSNNYLNIPLLIVGGKTSITSWKWSTTDPTAGGIGCQSIICLYRFLKSRVKVLILTGSRGKGEAKATYKFHRSVMIQAGTSVAAEKKSGSLKARRARLPSENAM